MVKNRTRSEPTSDVVAVVRQVVEECFEQALGPLLRVGKDNQPAMLLNSAESAKVLGISERTLWELKRSGEIAYVRMGNGTRKESIRYAVEDLKAFISRRRALGTDKDISPDS